MSVVADWRADSSYCFEVPIRDRDDGGQWVLAEWGVLGFGREEISN